MARVIEGVAVIAGTIGLGLFTGFGIDILFGTAWGEAVFSGILGIGASLTIGGIAQLLQANQQAGFSVRQSAAPRACIYGQFRTGGVYVYLDTTGSGESLNQVICWCAHQVQSIDTIYLDGRQVYLNSSHQGDGNTYTDPSGNQYSFGSVDVEALYHTLGTVPGTFFSSLAAVDGSYWQSTMTLDGLACTYLRNGYDVNRFTGPPAVKAAIHGKCDIYDPRSGTSGYTNNAALVIADFLCNTEWGVGCNYSAEINQAQLIAAANICDEQVPLAAGGYESRYTINGRFDSSSTPGEILDALLQACEGRISYTGGMWSIYPAAWYGSSLNLDQSALVANPTWTPYRKYRDLINCVRGTYICPQYPYNQIGYDQDHKDTGIFNGEWQSTSFPEYQQDALHGYSTNPWLTQDGNVNLYAMRSYRFVTSCAQAQRLAKIYLLRNRFQGSGTLKMSMAAYQLQAQDVFEFTFPALSMTDQYLEVSSFRLVPEIKTDEEGKNAPTISCELTVNQTDPSIYEWSDVEEMTVTAGQSPAFADPYTVAAPTALTLTSGQAQAVIGADGIITPRILITWTPPNDPFVASGGYVEIQWQINGTGAWNGLGHISPLINAYYLTGVVSGQFYNVQMRSVRANGASSAWVSVGPEEAVSTGSLVSNSFGTNAVSNPGFELNVLGGPVGDGWNIAEDGDGENTFYIERLTGAAHSGNASLLIRVQANVSIPAGAISGARVFSNFIPIEGGGPLYYGGWYNWASNVSLAAGLTYICRIGIYFWDQNKTFISEQYQQVLNTPNNAWAQLQGTCNAPSNAAFAIAQCCGFVTNPTGAAISTPSTLSSADLVFDDIFLTQQTGSGLLQAQGSINPSQGIIIPGAFTNSSCTLTWTAQSVETSSGFELTISSGSVNYSGLAASTTYYTYPYIVVATGQVLFANGSTPPTSPNSQMAISAALDGLMPLGTTSFTTLAASNPGSGSFGGGDTCPISTEMVDVQGKGQIPAAQVKRGDYILGYDFGTKTDVYRLVLQVRTQESAAWRNVDQHLVSPCEPIYFDGKWIPAYQASSKVDPTVGLKMLISVKADSDGEHNYWLVSGTRLLIHNLQIYGC